MDLMDGHSRLFIGIVAFYFVFFFGGITGEAAI
jgi:hypothetical protein